MACRAASKGNAKFSYTSVPFIHSTYGEGIKIIWYNMIVLFTILNGNTPNSQYPPLCFTNPLWIHIWACNTNQRWSVPCSCQLWGDVVSLSLSSLMCLNLNCTNFAWSSNCYPSIYKVVIYQVRQDCVCGNVGVLEPTFGRRKESYVGIDIELPWYVAELHIVVYTQDTCLHPKRRV